MSSKLIGFGTWVDIEGGGDPSSMQAIVTDAIHTGFRRFDTAHDYKTEPYVLNAVWTECGRENVHITSKSRSPPPVDQVREILSVSHNTHYDAFLLHIPPKTNNREEAEKELVRSWEIINEYQRKDITKHIGVSNFYRTHLDLLFSVCEKHHLTLPTINQLEIHPLCQERDYVKYLQDDRKIHVVAHTPIGGLACNMIFENEGIAEVAKRLGTEHLSQAILATTIFRGIEVIPRATKLEHMQQNFNSLQLVPKVTEDDLNVFSNIDMYTNMVDIALEAREFNDQL